MGDVVVFRPKALVEFEEDALHDIAVLSRLCMDTPHAIRAAQVLKANELLQRIDDTLIWLEAIKVALDLLEELSEPVSQLMDGEEEVIISTDLSVPALQVRFWARVRAQVIFVRLIRLRHLDATALSQIPDSGMRVRLLKAS
jgi:hypothetical protein